MSKHFPNLDPLRFFLASMVVLYHIPAISSTVGLPFFDAFPLFHKGSEAVFVFFTLSGFLIIRSLYLEKEKTNKISIKNFYLRRILRIYPVYYLVMFFGFNFYHLFLPAASIEYETSYNIWTGLFLCIAFLPNVFHVMFEPGSILSVLWSIGIEEQFYLLIAPIAFLLAKRRFIPFLIAFTITYYWIYFFSPISFFRDFFVLFFYFSFGGLLSILNHLEKDKFLIFNKLGQGILWLVVGIYFLTNLFSLLPESIYHLCSMIIFGVFVLNISRNPNPIFLIKNKTANYLGKISYGIYMYHMIVVNFVLFAFLKLQNFIALPNLLVIVLINVLTISLTIFASYLSYEYYEKFFLTLKGRFREGEHKPLKIKRRAKNIGRKAKVFLEDILVRR